MSSMTKGFPTPILPIRMMYGAFALFFDVLMIALLISSISLANTIRSIAMKMVLSRP